MMIIGGYILAGTGDGQATGDVEHPELFDPATLHATGRCTGSRRSGPHGDPYQYPDAPPGRGPVKTRTTSGSALPTLNRTRSITSGLVCHSLAHE